MGVTGWQCFPLRPRTCVRNGPDLCSAQCEPNRTTQSEVQHPSRPARGHATRRTAQRPPRRGPARPASSFRPAFHHGAQGNAPAAAEGLHQQGGLGVELAEPGLHVENEPCLAARIPERAALRHGSHVRGRVARGAEPGPVRGIHHGRTLQVQSGPGGRTGSVEGALTLTAGLVEQAQQRDQDA